MAVNQVSLYVYPPRWRQQSIADASATTVEGKPLQIVRAERVNSTDAAPVAPDAVRQWLADHQFLPAPRTTGICFVRGQVESIFGAEKEIEISAGEKLGEVTDFCVRFTLSRRTAPPLTSWSSVMTDLCRCFSLRLEPNGVAPLNASQFLAEVENDRNYRWLADSFGWSLSSDQSTHEACE